MGVKGVTLSPELDLARARQILPVGVLSEYVVHGCLPVMISEHCVMGNTGRCPADCRRFGRVLQDDKGFAFPLATDKYCRLHLFNSRITCLIEELGSLRRAGVELFRIEALLENEEQVGETVAFYHEALAMIERDEREGLKLLKQRLAERAEAPLTRLHLKRGVQ